MLDRRHRLTTSAGFTTATRRGRRAGTRHLVLHLGPPVASVDEGLPLPARVGFVVSKAVGNAVHRNRVKRRLRHLARDRVGCLPVGAVLVVRALPAAAGTTYSRLGQDFDSALRRLGLGPDASPEPSRDLARQEEDGR